MRACPGPLVFASYDSPLGLVYAAMEGPALLAVSFSTGPAAFEEKLSHGFGPSLRLRQSRAPFTAFFRDLDTYFKGHAVEFCLPVKLFGTTFQISVWKALARIPRGEVRSYAFIAEKVGSPRAFRAVAGACGQNMLPIVIPCHRVIRSDGSPGGWSGGGVGVKEGLLALEGVRGYKGKRGKRGKNP
ncbi:MAG: methylated-DNA--[protein]-cysteine S-methyltransferase [Thermodesulfobacteriota bacterium]